MQRNYFNRNYEKRLRSVIETSNTEIYKITQ
jgi:hypothetical protein